MQGRRPVLLVQLPHFLGDRNVALGRHFLEDEIHGEQRCKVLRAQRLMRTRMETRSRGRRGVGQDVVPLLRNLILTQLVLDLARHLLPLLNAVTDEIMVLAPGRAT